MSWIKMLMADAGEKLGAAPMRLLEAILEAGKPPDDGNNTFAVDKAAVLKTINTQEGKDIAGHVLRQRLKLINAAEIGLEVKSTKNQLIVELPPDTIISAKRREVVEEATQSTLKDTDINPKYYEQPRVEMPSLHQIFLSHAWEHRKVEPYVEEFCERLASKFEALPHPWSRQFRLSLWWDHGKMEGMGGTFDQQIDRECKKSSLAIFLHSDRWYLSTACQREAEHFLSLQSDEFQPFLRIQSTGKRGQNEVPRYKPGFRS